MDKHSWRHDGSPQGQNKLNICVKEEGRYKDIGDHVNDVDTSQSDTYFLVYTVNNSPSEFDSGSHILSEHDTIADAAKEASDVQRNNPTSVPL